MDFANIEQNYDSYQEWKEEEWLLKETEEEGEMTEQNIGLTLDN